MNLTELAERVTGKVGAQSTPLKVLKAASQEAKKSLRSGQLVDLLGVIEARLTPEGLSGKVTDASAVKIRPQPGLIREPDRMVDSDIVALIAVEKEDRFSKMLARRLSKPGRTAYVAVGVQGVMDAVKEHGADVLIMDSDLEMGDEIREWLKTDPTRSMISLIAVYQNKKETIKLNRFRVCEDEFLIEPYELEALESMIFGEITRIRQERRYFSHEVSFQFPTKTIFQGQAGDFMEKLVRSSGLDEPGQMGLVVAFREAVDNASRHGNRSDAESVVTVAYVVDKEKVTVTVEDEGPGFDTTMYLDTQVSGNAVEVARKRHKEGRQGGLGIMLMLKSVDKLEYNREGNVAKLTKFLKK